MKLLTVVCAVVCAHTAYADFVPGNFYTPVDGGRVVGWTPELAMASEFTVPGIQTVTGAVFNARGNLVMLARYQDTLQVLEVNSSGQIQNAFDTGGGTLLRGSYIDYHPATDRYVFADDDRITMLDGQLGMITSSPEAFERVTGVGFAIDGTVLGVDSFRNGIKRFSADLSEELSPIEYLSDASGGLDVRGDGNVLLTQRRGGQVDLLNWGTGEISPVVTGLGFGGVEDVQDLRNGTFVITDGRLGLSLFDAEGNLLATVAPSSRISDSLALFIPAPSSMLLMALAGLIGHSRRRREA